MAKRTIQKLSGFMAALGGLIGILNAPLLTLAWLAIPDGAENLESPWVAAWAAAVRPLLGSLLTFASPETVYTVYGIVMAPVILGFCVGLLGLHKLQASRAGRLEKIGFWLALLSTLSLLLGVIGAYGVGALEFSFFAFIVPGLLTNMIGTFLFGIGTLQAGVASRIAAWLLIVGSIPGFAALVTLFGHNSSGFLLQDVAWIIIGFGLWRTSATERGGVRADAARGRRPVGV